MGLWILRWPWGATPKSSTPSLWPLLSATAYSMYSQQPLISEGRPAIHNLPTRWAAVARSWEVTQYPVPSTLDIAYFHKKADKKWNNPNNI